MVPRGRTPLQASRDWSRRQVSPCHATLTLNRAVCDSTGHVPADTPSPAPPASGTGSPADAQDIGAYRGLRIDTRALPWTGPFARDYCHAFDRLAPFFRGSPADPESWSAAVAARHAHPPDPAVAPVIARQLADRGAPAEALAAADRLRDPRTVAVVTGQQAGLFGGPLFTLLKALTAITLARRIAAAAPDPPVVAVFWIDAEDHDLDEIRHCDLLGADLAPQSITLDLDVPAGTPAASVRLDDAITGAIDRLRETLPPTEFTAEVIDALAAAYAPGVRLVDAFARWLDRLLGAHGLIVFDASEPAAKPFVRQLFARELQAPGRTCALAATAGEQLTALGYTAQVSPVAGSTALFRMNGAREPIRVDGDGFVSGGQRVETPTLLAELDANPTSFSPNVLLRPIVQDTLLPTAALVAGPHELAYLAQLGEVYEAFGLPMPVLHARATATIVDGATLRFLTRYRLDPGRLQPRDDGVLNALLAAQLPASVNAALDAAEAATTERLAALREAVPAIDPTLAGAVDSTHGRMARDLGTLRHKVIQAAKRRDETLRRQFHRARTQCFPGGDPQERRVGSLQFLNQYGFPLVDRLLADLSFVPGCHEILTI